MISQNYKMQSYLLYGSNRLNHIFVNKENCGNRFGEPLYYFQVVLVSSIKPISSSIFYFTIVALLTKMWHKNKLKWNLIRVLVYSYPQAKEKMHKIMQERKKKKQTRKLSKICKFWIILHLSVLVVKHVGKKTFLKSNQFLAPSKKGSPHQS